MKAKDTDITIAALFNGLEVLSALSEKELPLKPAHQLARSLKTLRSEFETADGLRTKLIETYSKRDEEGNPMTSTTDDGTQTIQLTDPEEFVAKMQEFVDGEITCELYPIELTSLPDDLRFKARELELLLDMGVVTVEDN